MSDTLYDKNNISVDSTRYFVKGTMYPINTIASVKAHKHSKAIERATEKKDWKSSNAKRYAALKKSVINKTILSAVAGFAIYLIPHWVTGLAFLIALGFMIYAFIKLNEFEAGEEPDGPADRYSVKISTAAGDTDSYTSYNENEIQNIVMAINEAVAVRG